MDYFDSNTVSFVAVLLGSLVNLLLHPAFHWWLERPERPKGSRKRRLGRTGWSGAASGAG